MCLAIISYTIWQAKGADLSGIGQYLLFRMTVAKEYGIYCMLLQRLLIKKDSLCKWKIRF